MLEANLGSTLTAGWFSSWRLSRRPVLDSRIGLANAGARNQPAVAVEKKLACFDHGGYPFRLALSAPCHVHQQILWTDAAGERQDGGVVET